MTLRINAGNATAPAGSPFSATKMTVHPHKTHIVEALLRAEGWPVSAGQFSPTMQQIADLRQKLAAEGVVFE